MNVLVSWIGWIDFDRSTGRISSSSPNVDMHRVIKTKFDKHILLSSAPGDKLDNVERRQAMELFSFLKKEFRNKCDFDIRFLNIVDPYDYSEFYPKAEAILDEFKNDEITINFSIGTTSMRIIWAFLSITKNYNTKLIFGREPDKAKGNKPQFEQLILKSLTPEIHAVKIKELDDVFEPKITGVLDKVYQRAFKAARYNANILILGETGTGKEELARYIHKMSERKEKKIIAVNCAAIGDNLLESRLFGYKKGAFTGAVTSHNGFFKEADGGTIFLDEIGDISSQMQQSLLRVIQEKEVVALGDTRAEKIDIRIICATNKNLLTQVREGNFRADLYYRINEAEMRLPSLNNYPYEEKREIIDYVIGQEGRVLNKKLKFGNKVLSHLYAYSYPGNIRELIALIRNIYIFNEKDVDVSEVELLLEERSEMAMPLKLAEAIRQHVKKVYLQYGKNKKRTAEVLGIAVNTLNKYLKL